VIEDAYEQEKEELKDEGLRLPRMGLQKESQGNGKEGRRRIFRDGKAR
jgi:hypothetical protein